MWLRVASSYMSAMLAQYWDPRRRTGESGQSMVEYAIVAALIAVVAMAAIQALGGGIVAVFQSILAHIQGMAT